MEKVTVRFRTRFGGSTFIGEAEIEYTKGSGQTDEFGYTDDDEISCSLLEVWNEDAERAVLPSFIFAKENAPFRQSMEVAAFDELYNPTTSDKIFPSEKATK